jgi:small basic protein
MFLIPLLALFVGFLLIYNLRLNIPAGYADYLAIAILAGLDSILGGIRSRLENNFEEYIFTTGFFVNMALAASLAWLGDRMGVNLYLAVVVALGVRIFQNLGRIRGRLTAQLLHRRLTTTPGEEI